MIHDYVAPLASHLFIFRRVDLMILVAKICSMWIYDQEKPISEVYGGIKNATCT